MLAGCGHVERVELLANRWNAGEHKKCTFLIPNNLVCDGQQPLLHWEADRQKISLAKSIAVERGEYDALFSGSPTDYALWDWQWKRRHHSKPATRHGPTRLRGARG